MKRQADSIIDCIFFDLDHVLYMSDDFLLPTIKACAEIVRCFLEEKGVLKTQDEVYRDIMDVRDQLQPNHKHHFDFLFNRYNEQYGCFEDVDELFDLVDTCRETYIGRKIQNLKKALGKGAIGALDELKRRGYRLAIISNGRPEKQVEKLKDLGLYDYFCESDNVRIYVSEDDGFKKPFSYLWHSARRDMGLDLERCVMIGDMYWGDILGANELGITTIKVNQGKYANQTIDEIYRSKLLSGELKRFYGKELSMEEITKRMTPDYEIPSLDHLVGTIERIGPPKTIQKQ